MGRGGRRYPIEHAEGRELDFASLLWEALFSHKSPQGAQFRSELDGVFLHWRRLVRVLTSYRTSFWNGPSSDLRHLVDSLKSLTVSTRVAYPRPHTTPEIESEIAERSGIAATVINEVGRELIADGRYVNDRAKSTLSEATRTLTLWQNQPFWDANPGRRHRYSNHSYITRYLGDIEAFCSRWGLNAWWAAPSIIDSHFKRGTIGSKRPLSIYMRGSFRGISRNVVVVKLPGRTEADFRRDSARLQEVVAKKVIESSYGSFEVHERLSRSDMALLEESIDASCAVIDWWDDSAISPREIQAECEKRIGRTCTKNESRELSKQITAQVDSVRDFQLNNSWTTAPTRNLANRYMEHANWVAALILNPSSTYDALWPTTHDDSFRSHRRACRKFAEAAQLKLANRNTARSRRNGRSTTESFIN